MKLLLSKTKENKVVKKFDLAELTRKAIENARA